MEENLEDLQDYSLMREQHDQQEVRSLSLTPSEAANVETAQQLKSLTEQMNVLTGMFTELMSAMNPCRVGNALHL